jgi:hypothetical protein
MPEVFPLDKTSLELPAAERNVDRNSDLYTLDTGISSRCPSQASGNALRWRFSGLGDCRIARVEAVDRALARRAEALPLDGGSIGIQRRAGSGSDNQVTTRTLLSFCKCLIQSKLRHKLPCDNKLPT